MSAPPAPTWVRFAVDAAPHPNDHDARVERYRVERVVPVRGAPVAGVVPNGPLVRVESARALPGGTGDLVGATQHLGYTRAGERAELATTTPPGPDAICVVIPISRAAEWWGQSHDERDRLFRGAGTALGHVEVGRPHAKAIFRQLYHGRYLPGAGWDFLTYFEFTPEQEPQFQRLVAGLRDETKNPEWSYVARESEIWMRRAP